MLLSTKNSAMEKSDIGLIGLAVMGENLAINMERNGWKVSVWNRTVTGFEEGVVDRFMSGRGRDKNIAGYADLKDFIDSLKSPRKIMIMVKAGFPVDETIGKITPYLSEGDIIIDGGNSDFRDTERRVTELGKLGFHLVGAGISGGEEGALNGASIMPGGSEAAWPQVKSILQSIAARSEEGIPCCDWVGPGGAGHYVKMIHNGIEYSDMQLIAEAYSIMQHLTGLTNDDISNIFSDWNKRKLKSYLIEITARILHYRDSTGNYIIDNILDVAGQKGMGKLSVINALELFMPLATVATAVFERNISTEKELRERGAEIFPRDSKTAKDDIIKELPDNLLESLYLSRLISYAQSFSLMRKASYDYGWYLNLSMIAGLWLNGCVIRSDLLKKVSKAFKADPDLPNLIFYQDFSEEIKESLPAWKEVIAISVQVELPTPALTSALNYYYSITSKNLPANLIQAQRDYFGAHTFERTDDRRGIFFHEDWTHQGGNITSGTYNA